MTNDLVDEHYILTASCFDSLLSFDVRTCEAFDALQTLLAQPIPALEKT